MNSSTTMLDREQWFAVLERLADALGERSGGETVPHWLRSVSLRRHGWTHPAISTSGNPPATNDRRELARAAEAAGLLFDPKTDLPPDRPYLPLIDPIPAELGTFEPVFFERIGRLRLYRPPIENLIVSKLIRCEPRDLSDIRFLVSHYHPDDATIRSLIDDLSPRNREQASENRIYLTVFES